MFFYLSKILWMLVAPSNVLVGLVILGALLLLTPWARFGGGLVVAAALGFLVFATGPFAALLFRPLEARFPRPPATMAAPAGLIVLGGAVNEQMTQAHDQVALYEAAERMSEAVALMRRYPQARLVFSGGTNALMGATVTETDTARRFWNEMGVDPARLIFEDKSRNTYENAVLTRDLVQPKPGEVWLLVTSAYHMPRSMGIFRKAGFEVVAYPVDYRVFGDGRDFKPMREFSQGLTFLDTVTREWIGLAAYYLTGRSSALFPAP